VLFKEVTIIYSENHRKLINPFCGQNAELLVIKAGGAYEYSYHWGLKV
jgi:hypothetical protein